MVCMDNQIRVREGPDLTGEYALYVDVDMLH